MRIGKTTIAAPDDWRLELTAVTQRLLGDTITLSDDDWQVVTRLPGWSRAHVATHLAHHAEILTDMALEIGRTHKQITWRGNQSDEDLNSGALRGALDLQEHLDRSSAGLMGAFDQMDSHAWTTTLRTSQGSIPASTLMLDRLNEVVVHHIDLDLGFDFTDIAPDLVRILLQWNLFRAAPRFAGLKLTVTSDEGFSTSLGRGTKVTLRGSEANLVGWLTGRKDSSVVLGAEDLDLSGPV